MNKDLDQAKKDKLASIRKNRSLVNHGPLAIDKSDLQLSEFKYRIVEPHKITQAESLGWEVDPTEVKVGSEGLTTGSQGMKLINLKGGKNGTLMRLPMYIKADTDKEVDNKIKQRDLSPLKRSDTNGFTVHTTSKTVRF